MRTIFLTLFFAFSPLSLERSSSEVLRLGYIDFSPYISEKKGKVSGHLFDYFHALYPKRKIQWIYTPLKRVISSLNNNKIDMFATFFKSPEREKLADFSEQPIFEISPVLCGNKFYSKKKRTKNDYLKGKKVLHADGTLQYLPFFKMKSINFKSLSNIDYSQRALQLVALKRTDFAYIVDRYVAQVLITKNRLKNIHCYPTNEKSKDIFTVFKNFSLEKKGFDERRAALGSVKILLEK